MAVIQTETVSSKKKRVVRNAAIVFVGIVLLLTFFSSTINNFLLPAVECGNIVSGTLSQEITAQGEVVPLSTESVHAYGNWKIKDVIVKEGDTVKKGSILAVIDSGDTELEIKKMELNLSKMENELKLYKNSFQALDIEQYKNDEEAASRAMKKAQKKLENQKTLFEADAATLESVNEVREQLENANIDYQQKQRVLKQKEAEAEKAADNYSITLAEKEDDIAIARLELQNLEKNISADGKIKSPVDGTIKSIPIVSGTMVSSGQLLFDIVKNETGLAVKWTLDGKAANEVELKDEVEFSGDLPEEFVFNGKIEQKKLLTEGTGYEFVTPVKDVDVKLEAGQKVDISIRKSVINYNAIVPSSAVIDEQSGNFIYLLKSKEGVFGEENYLEKVQVDVLDADDFNTAISDSRIDSEDKIVIFSTKPLSDGIQVKLR